MRRLFSHHGRWLAPGIWMMLIFAGSTDGLSAHHTSRFVEPLLRWLFHGALSAQGIDEIHFLIRKAGHVTEYAVLSILFWWALPPGRRPLRADGAPAAPSTPSKIPRAAWAIVLAAGFAASDEFHQSFVPTRGASVEDVLIDTGGAILGLAALFALGNIRRSFQGQRLG